MTAQSQGEREIGSLDKRTKGRSLHTVQVHTRDFNTKALEKSTHNNSISTNPFHAFPNPIPIANRKERKKIHVFRRRPLPGPPSPILACLHLPTIDRPSLLGKGLGEGRGGSKVQRPRKAHYTQTMFLLKNNSNTRSCKKKKNSSPPPLFQSSHNNNIRRL